MSNQQFIDLFIGKLNDFRKDPVCIIDRMKIFQNGILRLGGRKNEVISKKIDKLCDELNRVDSLKLMSKNEQLTEYAENYIKQIKADDDSIKFVSKGNEIKDKIPKEYYDQDCAIFYIGVVTDEQNLLINLLINEDDIKEIGKSILKSNLYTQIGMAYDSSNSKECYAVIIFAKKYVEPFGEEEEEQELPDGDLTELKQAFDLFDVDKIGLISPKDTFESMKAINYDKKNPELFRIMRELQQVGKMVDFPSFAWHIVDSITDTDSKKGLKTIFNLYVDDFDNNTIGLDALKKICKRLKERNAEKQVDELLQGPNAGARLTFDEFYDYMKGEKSED